jgi:hypothetical protein
MRLPRLLRVAPACLPLAVRGDRSLYLEGQMGDAWWRWHVGVVNPAQLWHVSF